MREPWVYAVTLLFLTLGYAGAALMVV